MRLYCILKQQNYFFVTPFNYYHFSLYWKNSTDFYPIISNGTNFNKRNICKKSAFISFSRIKHGKNIALIVDDKLVFGPKSKNTNGLFRVRCEFYQLEGSLKYCLSKYKHKKYY